MKLILSFVLFVTATGVHAIPLRRESQDLKLVTQQLVEKQTITNPAAAGTNDVLNASAGNTSTTAATITTFVAQPDVARNFVITPGSTTADVAACNVVVNGTDFNGGTIAETFSFLDNASTATTGSKAFKTITSVVFPANCEDSPFGATWSVGYGEKLGLKRCMDAAGHVVFSTVGGTYESTRPTVTADSTVVSGNTADFNGTMNGSNDFEIFFFQNFRCF